MSLDSLDPGHALTDSELLPPPTSEEVAAYFDLVDVPDLAAESSEDLGADPVLSISQDTMAGVRVTEETASMIASLLSEIEELLGWMAENMAVKGLQELRTKTLAARAKKDLSKRGVSEEQWAMIEERIVDMEYVIAAFNSGIVMSHEHSLKLPSRAEVSDLIRAHVETSSSFHPPLEIFKASDLQVDPRFMRTFECSDGLLNYGIHVFDDGQLAVVIN
ncbi:hypothetical protein HY605_02375 [Candidatus Peregrinibacteria bacterium]|nr:hypothetical protein [Candidatus Peregrinibacteria bacterium]